MSDDVANANIVAKKLAQVDYSFKDYVPSSFALEFINFVKLVNGTEGEENESPVMHYKMLDDLISDDPQVADMVFRGAGKSTLLAEYLFLYLAVFKTLGNLTDLSFAIYVSDSIDNGVKSMRKSLEARWNKSEFLQRYLPKIQFTDLRWEFLDVDGNVFAVKAYGAKSGVRGTKEYNQRPQIAVLDDLISDVDAKSPTVIENVKAVVYEAVINALHPKRQKVIWLGTPFNAKDPLYEAINTGAFTSSVYPICEKFPCTKAQFKGAWEDRFDYDYVKMRYDKAVKAGRVHGFYRELMLQISSDDERLIDEGDINWYSVQRLLQKRGDFNFYITTDFAVSAKESADYSAISVWAVNNKGFYFWVDGICKRQTMDKNIHDLFLLAVKYQVQSVGIETTGQQGGFVAWINQEMMNKNIYFMLQSIRPTQQKFERFQAVVPQFKQKRFYFPIEAKQTQALQELLNELYGALVGGFSTKHDDMLDTVSMLSMMEIYPPSGTVYHDNSQVWGEPVTPSHALQSYVV